MPGSIDAWLFATIYVLKYSIWMSHKPNKIDDIIGSGISVALVVSTKSPSASVLVDLDLSGSDLNT